MKFLLIPIAVFLLALNFIPYNIVEDNDLVVVSKKFDPSLTRLNSLAKLEAYIDSLALTKNIAPGTLAYAIEAEQVVGQRFYHKYSTQNLDENFIASVTQKITGLYLSSKITADDILTKPYGYCGQQNTVLMELLHKKKHDYRVIYFAHHFAIKSFINGQWCYFDANMPHDILPYQRSNEKWLHNNDSLAIAYHKSVQEINFLLGIPGEYKLGKINEVQGANAQIFQSITKVFSKIAFLFPLFWFIYLTIFKKVQVVKLESKDQYKAGRFILARIYQM